jgi:hypothetical protein
MTSVQLLSTPNGMIAKIPVNLATDAEIRNVGVQLGNEITFLDCDGVHIVATTVTSMASRIHQERLKKDHVNPALSDTARWLHYAAVMFLESRYVRLFNRQPGLCGWVAELKAAIDIPPCVLRYAFNPR